MQQFENCKEKFHSYHKKCNYLALLHDRKENGDKN